MLARATSRGSTPARWSRTAVRASPTGRCRAPLPANTFAPRYSTLPESSAASVTMRNPSSRLARTCAVRESMAPGAAGTSVAQCPLRPSCSAMRAPTWVAVASTIAIRFNPPPRPSCPERKKTTPNSTGPSSAPTQNQRVRTRSTNSRRTIAQILRIGSHAGLRRLRADQIAEDLQERWLAQLEVCQPRPRRDQVAQLADLLFHHEGNGGAQAGDRHVHHHERRLVQDAGDELHLLLHSPRQLIDAAHTQRRQAEPLEPFAGALARAPPLHPLHFAKEHQHVEHAHLAIQAALLGEITDPLGVAAAPGRRAE